MPVVIYIFLALFSACAVIAVTTILFRLVGILGMSLFSLILLVAIPLLIDSRATPLPFQDLVFWRIIWFIFLMFELLAINLLYQIFRPVSHRAAAK